MHLFLGKVASTDPGLVGDDEKFKPVFSQSANSFAGTGDQFDLVRFVEVAGLDDERSVAVEEDCRFAVGHRRSKTGEKFLRSHGGRAKFSDHHTGCVVGEHGRLDGIYSG